MRRVRVVAVAASALLLTAVGAGTAHACIGPNVSATPSAGPGDAVNWVLSDISAEAEIHVSFNGEVLRAGPAGATTVRGQFVMPNLGDSPKTVYLYARVSPHDVDGSPHEPGTPSTEIAYRVNTVAPPAENAPTQDGSSPPAAVNSPERNADPAPRGRSRTPARSAPDETGSRGDRETARERNSVERRGTRVETGARQNEAVAQPVEEPSRNAAQAVDSGDRAAAAGTKRSARSAPAPAETDQSQARPFDEPAPVRAIPAVADDGNVPVPVVAAIALLTLAGIAGAFVARKRSGGSGVRSEPVTPSPPPDPALEAELQEIIAEERAARELEPGPS